MALNLDTFLTNNQMIFYSGSGKKKTSSTSDEDFVQPTGICYKFDKEFTIENFTKFLKDETKFSYVIKIESKEFTKIKASGKDLILMEYYFDFALSAVNAVKNSNENLDKKQNVLLKFGNNISDSKKFVKWRALRTGHWV